MMLNIFASLLCLLMSTAGIVFLRACWRKSSKIHRLYRIAAWAMLCLSLVAWSFLFGAEFGLVVALSVPALAAWVSISFGIERKKKQHISGNTSTTSPATSAQIPSKGKTWRKFLIFVIAGPLAVVSLCFVTIEFVRFIPAERATQMVIGAFLYPTLLGLASYWVCYNNKPLRDGGILLGASILSALHLFAAQIL
ncbi:hypothetical protein TDB9533_04574 [Thalassocella blandensis]|nr:hypothetical protein TDB9533_04574 [Thalassocella blandensis]